MARVPRNDVTVSSGQDLISVYTFADTSSGAPKEKMFCKTCGATVWTIPGAAKGDFFFLRTTLLSGWSVVQSPSNLVNLKN
jgi:hypothetical protein